MAALRAAPPGASGNVTAQRLIAVVDKVPQVRGCGVVFRRGQRMHRLRAQGQSGATVVFELNERLINPSFLVAPAERRGPYLHNPRFSAGPQLQPGWSVRALPGGRVPLAALTPRPGAAVPKRTGQTSVADEWLGLGLNCGGAIISWIGVVGTGLATPLTGGASAFASAALYIGAAASTVQCTASVYRVANVQRGRTDLNRRLDNSSAYYWTMWGADAIGLYGVATAAKGVAKTGVALRRAGVGAGQAVARPIDRAARRQAGAALGMAGVAGSRAIHSHVRKQLLEGAGAALGVISSVQGGVIKELIVWVVEE